MAEPSSDSAPSGFTSPIDVSQLMGAFKGVQSMFEGSLTDLQGVLSTGRQAVGQEESGIKAASEAQQQIDSIKGAALAKKQAADADAASFFGTNPNTSSFVLAAMGDTLLAQNADIMSRQDMIQQKADAKFLDDPLQFIINQLTLPLDIAASNIKQSQFERNQEALKELQDRTREASVTNALVDAADANAIAAEQNKVTAAKAQQDLAIAQQKMTVMGLQGLQIKDAIGKGKWDALLGYNTALVQQQDLIFKDREYQLQTRREQYYEWLKADQIADKEERQRQEAAFQAKLNIASDVAGFPRIPIAEFKLMQGPRRNILENLMVSPDTDVGAISYDTAHSLDAANAANMPLTPGINDIRSKLIKIEDAIVAKNQVTNMGNWNQLKPEEQLYLKQQGLQEAVSSELRSIPTSGGIYSPPSLRATLTANADIEKLPISQLLKPQAANPNYETNVNDIMTAGLKLVASGKYTPGEVAQQINKLYEGVILTNNNIHNYGRLRLPGLDPERTGYNQSVTGAGDTPNLWGGGSKTIDMVSRPAVENALTRMIINLSQQNTMRLQQGGGAFP